MENSQTIDITIARITHVEWVHQLELLLHSSTSSVTLPSYHDCEFGVWLYGDGLRTYKEIPEIVLLEKSHKTFISPQTTWLSGTTARSSIYKRRLRQISISAMP